VIHSGENATYSHHREHRYLGYGGTGGLTDAVVLRQWYDSVNWGFGGWVATIWCWYYSPTGGHGYQRYFGSCGYSSHAASFTAIEEVGAGVSGAGWETNTQASGNIYRRDFTVDIPAYVHCSCEVEWTSGLYHTTDFSQTSGNYIWVGG
tara:strand:- start:238 stop:684 length:447 start_codon:yes stop_codon:yes gene_type:complete